VGASHRQGEKKVILKPQGLRKQATLAALALLSSGATIAGANTIGKSRKLRRRTMPNMVGNQ
jgi:hypothetical protein